jgi:hypothetical protein
MNETDLDAVSAHRAHRGYHNSINARERHVHTLFVTHGRKAFGGAAVATILFLTPSSIVTALLSQI